MKKVLVAKMNKNEFNIKMKFSKLTISRLLRDLKHVHKYVEVHKNLIMINNYNNCKSGRSNYNHVNNTISYSMI